MREETILNAINDLDSINCMIQDIHESIYQDSPDYWTRLEHQAAIAAMGGMCGNTSYDETYWEDMAENAIRAAHALVKKMKEERK